MSYDIISNREIKFLQGFNFQRDFNIPRIIFILYDDDD